MSRSRKRKRGGFKPKSTDCNLCFFNDTCNLKTAKICNSFVPANSSLKTEEPETPIVRHPCEVCNEITAPASSSEYAALIIFAILLIVGCAYLVWR